jgi:hypothetical protein
MRQFQSGVLSKQSHDSMMGREGIANVGHPYAARYLGGTIGLSKQM